MAGTTCSERWSLRGSLLRSREEFEQRRGLDGQAGEEVGVQGLGLLSHRGTHAG